MASGSDVQLINAGGDTLTLIASAVPGEVMPAGRHVTVVEPPNHAPTEIVDAYIHWQR